MKKLLIFIFCVCLGLNVQCFASDFTQAHVRQILLENVDDVYEVQLKLKQGESFEELAKEYSICKTGQKGGDMADIKKGVMVEEFDNAIADTPVGGISKPFRTQFGWHIIKVIRKK